MNFIRILAALLFLPLPALADTLYQANVGGYSTGSGFGFGVDGGTGYTAQNSVNSYSGYSPGVTTTGIPYDSFTYPYSSKCCGCNTCNNCDTSYANGRR